ncbi:uncharacterized protein K452DRAFT_124314 [Aplosporella prunicola CBS 121167]|uniref:Ubiquitin-like domain-containing protein n=1 Tax=Aplosporella prunicola CBS 121167 TaxID=1176127 RepID=A0A6A6BNK4_9PEZI|nr:uncharacterized protein K452DRAFT_124314 [Aplosporella prunicola CBS 121167]KAF2145710.1 hypothetical protein K452DRAFT_124314 [Aplosporella prunicola CBS 121167]
MGCCASIPRSRSGASTTTESTAKDTRPNKRLMRIAAGRRSKPPKVDERTGPLTRARLATERAAFWDTRVTGRAEMWGGVKLSVEALAAGDVASAQGVLDAAGLTCPTGELWRGVYDERGEEYKVPEWVVVEPVGLVEEVVEEEDVQDDGGGDAEEEDEEEEDSVMGKQGAEEEDEGDLGKGKGKDRVGEVVKVKARLSDRGTDVVVEVGMEEGVAALKAKIVEAGQVAASSRVRLAYMGRMLNERASLASQGYRAGDVVSALVQ